MCTHRPEVFPKTHTDIFSCHPAKLLIFLFGVYERRNRGICLCRENEKVFIVRFAGIFRTYRLLSWKVHNVLVHPTINPKFDTANCDGKSRKSKFSPRISTENQFIFCTNFLSPIFALAKFQDKFFRTGRGISAVFDWISLIKITSNSCATLFRNFKMITIDLNGN